MSFVWRRLRVYETGMRELPSVLFTLKFNFRHDYVAAYFFKKLGQEI